MKKLLLPLFLLSATPAAVLLAPALVAPAVAALPASALSDQQLLAKAQDYVRRIGRVRYEVTVEREGVSAGGRVYLDRAKRRARIEVDQPFRDLILVDGPVIQYQGGNGTVTRQATRASPLRLLFEPDVDFSTEARLVGVGRHGDQVSLTLEQPDTPRAGQITLHFGQTPEWHLIGWDFVDPKGVRGRVTIDYVRTDATFRDDLFRMRDDFLRGGN